MNDLPKFVSLSLLLILLIFCNRIKTPAQKLHIEKYNWDITVPRSFKLVDIDEWIVERELGDNSSALSREEDYGYLCVFRYNDDNYFTARYEPVDTLENYYEFRNYMQRIYIGLTKREPGTTYKSSETTTEINGIGFHKFKIEMQFPSGAQYNMTHYYHVFDKEALEIEITSSYTSKGRQMERAFEESMFGG